MKSCFKQAMNLSIVKYYTLSSLQKFPARLTARLGLDGPAGRRRWAIDWWRAADRRSVSSWSLIFDRLLPSNDIVTNKFRKRPRTNSNTRLYLIMLHIYYNVQSAWSSTIVPHCGLRKYQQKKTRTFADYVFLVIERNRRNFWKSDHWSLSPSDDPSLNKPAWSNNFDAMELPASDSGFFLKVCQIYLYDPDSVSTTLPAWQIAWSDDV